MDDKPKEPKQKTVAIETLEQVIATWREKEQEICRAADVYDTRGQRAYGDKLAVRAEAIAKCADGLEALTRQETEP